MRFFRFLAELFGDAWERSARPSDRIRKERKRSKPKRRERNEPRFPAQDTAQPVVRGLSRPAPSFRPEIDTHPSAAPTPQRSFSKQATIAAAAVASVTQPIVKREQPRQTLRAVTTTDSPKIKVARDPAVEALWPARPAPLRLPPVSVPKLAVQGKAAAQVTQQMKTYASMSEASVPTAVALSIANDARRDIAIHGNTADKITINHLQQSLSKESTRVEQRITARERTIVKAAQQLPAVDRERVNTFLKDQVARKQSEINFTKHQLVSTQAELTQTQLDLQEQKVQAIKSQVERKALKEELRAVRPQERSATNPVLMVVYGSAVAMSIPLAIFTGIGLALARTLRRRRPF